MVWRPYCVTPSSLSPEVPVLRCNFTPPYISQTLGDNSLSHDLGVIVIVQVETESAELPLLTDGGPGVTSVTLKGIVHNTVALPPVHVIRL